MFPFFSIVIPTLNEQEFLPLLLTCLAQQVFKDFEVIVVDGRSDDKTVEVARRRGARVVHSPRQNVAFQRNLGAKNAQGEYLVFFDADVLLKEDFLAEVAGFLKNGRAHLVSTWLVPDSDRIVDRLYLWLENYSIKLCSYIGFKRVSLLPGHNIFVARDTFLKLGGFDDKLAYFEDYVFAQKAKEQGVRLHFLGEPKQTICLRRLRSEGYVALTRKFVKVFIHVLFTGKISNNIIDYRMGGHVHLRQEKE